MHALGRTRAHLLLQLKHKPELAGGPLHWSQLHAHALALAAVLAGIGQVRYLHTHLQTGNMPTMQWHRACGRLKGILSKCSPEHAETEGSDKAQSFKEPTSAVRPSMQRSRQA